METKEEEEKILNCGLCFKFLNEPKRLPCLHVCCASCLREFLLSIEMGEKRSYECPKCAGKVLCPDKVSVAQYVNDLPTYKLMETVIKRKKVVEDGTVCGPCQVDGKNQKATLWCKDCDEGLCDECYKFHQRSKISRTHNVIKVQDFDKHQQLISVDHFCPKHTEKTIDHFCYDHSQSCCPTCVTTMHRKCNKITTLEDAAKNTVEKEFVKIPQRIKEDLSEVTQSEKDREDFLKELACQQDDIKKMIQSLRKDINKHLNDLETKFETEFNVLHNEHFDGIKLQKDRFSNIREMLGNCGRLVDLLLRSSTEIELFLEKDNILTKLTEQERLVAELSSEPFKVKYELSLTPELTNVLESVHSLGVVKCVKVTPVQLTVGEFHVTLGEDDSIVRKNKPQEILTFDTNKCNTTYIHGVELLSDGRMLLTNAEEKSLYLYDNEGTFQCVAKIPGKPRDVTLLNDNEAAVTYHNFGDESGICITDINTGKTKQSNIIQNRGYEKPCGIASHKGKVFIVCKDRIVIINTNGKLIKEIKTSSTSNQWYITAVSDKALCYTSPADHSVVCVDMDGTVVFTYKHEDLSYPEGITSDGEGVIYAAGKSSNNVHQISPDGQLIQILLCKSNGVTGPFAINFERNNNKLVLTHSNSKISIYEMKK